MLGEDGFQPGLHGGTHPGQVLRGLHDHGDRQDVHPRGYPLKPGQAEGSGVELPDPHLPEDVGFLSGDAARVDPQGHPAPADPGPFGTHVLEELVPLRISGGQGCQLDIDGSSLPLYRPISRGQAGQDPESDDDQAPGRGLHICTGHLNIPPWIWTPLSASSASS